MNNLANLSALSIGPFGNLDVSGIIFGFLVVIILVALKGFALWTAAKRDQNWWFIIMLFVNTFGILELIYMVFISKKWRSVRSA